MKDNNLAEPATHVKLIDSAPALPIVGTIDLSTAKVSLNPFGMVRLLTRRPTKRKEVGSANN